MTFIAFCIGIVLPVINGYLLVRLLEGKTIVLALLERIALGYVIGMTLMMFFIFLMHITTGAPLTLALFLIVHIFCTIILLSAGAKFKMLSSAFSSISFQKEAINDWIMGCFIVLGFWMLLKIVVTATMFLGFAPTYLDDSLDAWNLRGKLYYIEQAITLVLPGEDPAHSRLGVSSYPPTVPLAKVWVSTLAGQWNNSLINSIQILWYLAALVLVFFAIRRHIGLFWALVGTYMIGSMPLYLMHGTNAYADCFLSVHIFAALGMLFHALHTPSMDTKMAFFRLSAIATALLPFTKNEGMLVYLPPLLLLLVLSLLLSMRQKSITAHNGLTVALWFGCTLLLIAGPWLLFKWSNGLTFGNGKPFTSLGIGWHENVLLSIAINTFFEGNWLLLFPLLFVLIAWKWKAAFGPLSLLTLYFLMIYIGQGLLYLYTDLATEALRQTGYARGLIHLTPVVILLTTLLLERAFPGLRFALAKKREMAAV